MCTSNGVTLFSDVAVGIHEGVSDSIPKTKTSALTSLLE